MHVLDWPFLDALQTGALAALFISFGTDALARRDRMMGWMALTCLLVGIRHAVLAIGSHPAFNPDLVDRIQSLAVSAGFVLLCQALRDLFPRHIPARFPLWVAAGLMTNVIRNLALAHPTRLDLWLHHAANAVYLVASGAIITWALRAREDGDPMGRRLFLGLLGVFFPVVVEITALSLFDLKIRLSGFSMVVLAMAIGTSWQWLVVQSMEARTAQAEQEAEAWRSLLPSLSFRTDQPSKVLENLFGADWAQQVQAHPEGVLSGTDGLAYRVRSRVLGGEQRLGWFERSDAAQTGFHGFLSGWTFGVGVDDPALQARFLALLKAWGAEVQLWGTMPPREGPYPSVLLWAREPSILSVWREDDLLRRRPRWIQLGGPATEGPHVRLEPQVEPDAFKRCLEELLSRH